MSKSWTFTTYENGKPVARHEGLSHQATMETIARAMNPLFDVEDKLSTPERRSRERTAA